MHMIEGARCVLTPMGLGRVRGLGSPAPPNVTGWRPRRKPNAAGNAGCRNPAPSATILERAQGHVTCRLM